MCHSMYIFQITLKLPCYVSVAGPLHTVHYYTADTVHCHISWLQVGSHISTLAPFVVSISTHAENDEARNDNSNNLQYTEHQTDKRLIYTV